MKVSLAQSFYQHSRDTPDAAAVSTGNLVLSYSQLGGLASRIGAWLAPPLSQRPIRVGILGSRSAEACAAVLGASWAGATYVPFSPKLPEERLIAQLKLSRLDALIADARGSSFLTETVLKVSPPKVLVAQRADLPGRAQVDALDELPTSLSAQGPIEIDEAELAYIIFTSGTTGVPKGVMVTAGSVARFLAMMGARYTLTSDDRVSENTDLSFDVSVANMYMTWQAGACLCIVPPNQAMAPGKFIRDNQLTVWSSVPSVISFMKNLKQLKANAFPTLRYSLFAGEGLSLGAAQAWQIAAPNSVIDNNYGPTEATIVCIGHRYQGAANGRDMVATGTPMPGNEAAILDSNCQALPPGQAGELALSGSQLALGYLDSPQLTSVRFPIVNGKRWYLTGDLAMQDEAGIFHHLGRIDNQVKVLGNRVELEEIESHLRAVSGCEMVAAVGWPMENGSANGVVAFVCNPDFDPSQLREALKKRLPAYMVPGAIHRLESLPLNPNGKLDRQALVAGLNQTK